MADDKWYSRALPIMEVVNGYEDEGRDIVQVAEIAEATGLQSQHAFAELRRLVYEGFVGDQIEGTYGGDPGDVMLNAPTLREKGARSVEAWPSDDPYDALVTLLDRRLAEETDEDRRGKLRKTREVVLDVGKGVLVGVLADLARRPLYALIVGFDNVGFRRAASALASASLAQIMQVAVENEWIARVPTPTNRPRTPTAKRMRALSLAEVNELAEVIDPFFATLVVTAAVSGMRWGELAGLRVENVDLLHRRIRVVEQITEVRGRIAVGELKTPSARRSVSIPPFLVPLLEEQIAERSSDGFLFQAEEGGPLRRSNFRDRVWLPAVRRAGFDGLRFHDLRHTAVTLAITAGANAKQIQERMGHSTVRLTLDRYGHLLEGSDEQVADRLEAMFRAASNADS